MIINGKTLLEMAPIKDMIPAKRTVNGVSHGLSEAGYDIRLKQDVMFDPYNNRVCWTATDGGIASANGRFCIASAIEEFQLPPTLTGIVHDKSTWARHGLSVFNTVIEPGWHGFLTLELVYHGRKRLELPAGSGIAQVVFHRVVCPANYAGKYQNQADGPVPARFADESLLSKSNQEHVDQAMNNGPVPIITASGVKPSNLDAAVAEQAAYYQPDPTKRGFTPK